MQPSRIDTIDEIIEYITFSCNNEEKLREHIYSILNKMSDVTYAEFFECANYATTASDIVNALTYIASQLFDIYSDNLCEDLELMKDEVKIYD